MSTNKYVDYKLFTHHPELVMVIHPDAKVYFTKNPKVFKLIKKMIVRSTGGLAKYINVENPIFIAFKKNERKQNKMKPMGIAMLSKYSPEKHFESEKTKARTQLREAEQGSKIKEKKYEYLYNMIVLNNNLRVAPSLITEVKKYCISQKSNQINLDVSLKDVHATKFYLNNFYKIVGGYTKNMITWDGKKESSKFICMTYKFHSDHEKDIEISFSNEKSACGI